MVTPPKSSLHISLDGLSEIRRTREREQKWRQDERKLTSVIPDLLETISPRINRARNRGTDQHADRSDSQQHSRASSNVTYFAHCKNGSDENGNIRPICEAVTIYMLCW